jgi:hypothetical protein
LAEDDAKNEEAQSPTNKKLGGELEDKETKRGEILILIILQQSHQLEL